VSVTIYLRHNKLTVLTRPIKLRPMALNKDTQQMQSARLPPRSHQPLYSPAERIRRDQSVWTLVQGVLAPLQFAVFLGSLWLVLRFLATGEGLLWATYSVVLKTFTLYVIMIAGCIWEKVVFGRYLFAPAFFWEDVFSMLVLALHTMYLAALFTDSLGASALMYVALAAYAAYLVNAGQFLLKLRAARLDEVSGHNAAPTHVEASA